MKIRVLGAAAGGGFPQWNCNCPNCDGLRKGTIRASARTQSSIAVTGDGESWVLFNTSPDILAQIRALPALQPSRHLRDTAIAAIVLVDSQVDHTTGLLMLREGKPLTVYCTDMVRDDMTVGNPLFKILAHYCDVNVRTLALDGTPVGLPGGDNLRLTAVPIKSKPPPYSPHRDDPHLGDNIGVWLENLQTGKRLFYAPGIAEIEPHLEPYLKTADCLMIDGTFWRDDEMILLGISKKHAREMGHLPQSGEGGMIDELKALARARKILVHINNTNPILNEDSPERAELTCAGIEVAYDGMEIDL